MKFIEDMTLNLKNNEETGWQKASASLDATAKIYGFRVDNIHSETYKIIGGLSRKDGKEDSEDIDQDNEGKDDKKEKKRTIIAENTLEKNPDKLKIEKDEILYNVDPLYSVMTSKFADTGAKAMLLNTVPIDTNLNVILDYSLKEVSDKITCSTKQEDLSLAHKKLIEDFNNKTLVDELVHAQMVPQLEDFIGRNNETFKVVPERFLDLYKEKIDNMNDDENLQEEMENIMTEYDEGMLENNEVNNDPEMDDKLSLQTGNKSELESVSRDVGASALIANNSISFGMFNNTSFIGDSFNFKQDTILEHEKLFGDGNIEILKNSSLFQNFAKGFNNVERGNMFKNNINKEKGKNKKDKQEETLFDISIKNIVKRNEIYGKESKKMKDEKIKKKIKKKVIHHCDFDRNYIYKLFSWPDRKNNLLINNNNNIYIQEEDERVDNNFGDGDIGNNDYNDNEMNFINDEPEKNGIFNTYDDEFFKEYGQIFKQFDVKVVKNHILSSIDNVCDKNSNKEGNFKDIINDLENTLDFNTINNISTSTCFVCLLHLCNEKGIELTKCDKSNFTVSKS